MPGAVFQVTSYGGNLRYSMQYVPGFDQSSTNGYPDVEISVRINILHYVPGFNIASLTPRAMHSFLPEYILL